MQTTFSISSTIYDTNMHAHDHFHFLPSDVRFQYNDITITTTTNNNTAAAATTTTTTTTTPTTAWYVHTDNHFQTHFITYNFIYQYFNYLPHTQIYYISGWCHHIQNISTCSSAQIILSILYSLTKILNILIKT